MSVSQTVYVVDDDAAVRRSLERLLDSMGFQVISYETAFSFLNAAPNLKPGCVLLDVKMPDMNGLELQAHLRPFNDRLPVIVITAYSEVQAAVRAMKAGAVDFIEKPYSDDLLLNAIEVAQSRAGRTDTARETTDAAKRIASLTPRERQVLAALVRGKPNKVIAFDLGIGVRTVEAHRARMMERLGVRQLAEAVRLAVLARLES